ncbi:hypothetical protein BBOR36S_02532 [Brevibacillus borstelensis]|jgi:hypothetical protein
MKLLTNQPQPTAAPAQRTYEDTLNNLAKYLQQNTKK